MSSNFDFDLMAEIAEQAPTAGGSGSFVNYGRVSASNWKAKYYDNDSKTYVERDYVPGTPVEKGEFVQFDLDIDIQELNPALTFNKSWRFISIRNSGKRQKDKTVWGETIAPSATMAFGDLKKFFKALVEGKTYCAIEDFATGEINKKGYDVTAPKFVAVFKNKKECEAARAEKYAKSDGEAVSSTNGKIPLEYVRQVQAMLKTNDESVVINIVNRAPEAFGNHSAKDLITAAQTEPPF